MVGGFHWTFCGRRGFCLKGKHSTFAHFPKDRHCEVCKRTKMTRAPCRRRTGNPVPRAEKFVDLITAGHRVLSEECESRNNHRYAVVVQDLATQRIQSYPCKTQTSQETEQSVRKFLESIATPPVIHTRNSLEFGRACEELSWNHCTFTPHRSETNGTAERAVHRLKEGTSAVLLQWGLDEKWWADSMEWYCYLRNVEDCLSNEKKKLRAAIWRTIQRTSNSFRIDDWVSYYYLLKTHRDCICQRPVKNPSKMVRKSYLVYSLDMHCMRAESGKETAWSRTWRSWKVLDASEIRETQCNGSHHVENLSKFSYSRSQMEQSSCLEQIRFSKDPLEFGTTLHERAQRCFSRRIRRVSTTRQINGRQWNEARNDFFGRSKGTTFCLHHIDPCWKKNHTLNHCGM